MTNDQTELSKLIEKVKAIEHGEKLDLSSGEDLSIGVMNLISIEEHLFFTANKTQNSTYYDLLSQVREMRKDLMKRLIKDTEGEAWCISKHLLAASMRLMEVGTKLQTKGDKTGAEELFSKSYKLYSLFWGITLDVVKAGDLKADATLDTNVAYIDDKSSRAVSTDIFHKLGEMVKKAIDCCKE